MALRVSDTLCSEEGLDEIRRINLLLADKCHNAPAKYQVELLEYLNHVPVDEDDDPSHPIPRKTFKLRLMREEICPGFVHGATQVITEDTLNISGGVLQSNLNTFTAAKALQNDHQYMNKGFGALLVHLMVYCGVCADLQMVIDSTHIETCDHFSKYAEFACGLQRHHDPDGMEMMLNASNLSCVHCNQSEVNLNPLNVEQKKTMKQYAESHINSLLKHIKFDNVISPSANVYMVDARERFRTSQRF